MSSMITFSTFTGYGMSYELLEQFCTEFQKKYPKRPVLLGPTCIVAEHKILPSEKHWLEQHCQVTKYEQCLYIDFDGPDSEDEKQLKASTWPWCANIEDGIATVALPDIVSFLSMRSFE